MNLCESCKYFKPPHCMSDKVYDGASMYAPDFSADCFGTSYNDSTIIVGPKFGCVHWEAK